MRTIQQVLTELPADLERGLDSDGVAQSFVKFGPNRLTALPREPVWRKFLAKFDEPIIKILLAAALLSVVVDLFRHNRGLGAAALVVVVSGMALAMSLAALRRWAPSLMFGLALLWVVIAAISGHPSYEGLAVMVAVVLATGVAFYSEHKSGREFEVLNARKDEIQVKVTRGGAFHTVLLEDIVVGDLVTLEMGDEVPADGRIVQATELLVNESLMTGESLPVQKQPRPPDDASDGPGEAGSLFRGTQVVDGVGRMLVTEVGDATSIGQIAHQLSADAAAESAADGAARVRHKLTISKQLTPLQLKLAELASLISKVGYIAAAAIFVALVARGLVTGELGADLFGSINYLLNAFVYMVIVVVVAVPEGLPMSVTVSLALAMRKMTRSNSLVRQLVACETIGSATVICSDKTGTLTQNRMRVERVGWDGRVFDRDSDEWVKLDARADWPRDDRPVDYIALNAAVNSTAHLEMKEGGRLTPIGNTTEGALLQWLQENGLAYADLRLKFPPAYQIHFSSERKLMTTVIDYGGRLTALIKGAPEVVIERSSHYLTADGAIREWNESTMTGLLRALADSTGQAMRALAFAYKLLPKDMPTLHGQHEHLEGGYVFVGFVAIRDPLRDDVKDALRQCRAAGIEVKMITGDNVETARAIARDVGLLDTPDAQVLTHDEFDAMSDEQLGAVMPHLRVLARARPLDKLRIVNVLQSQNHVVAMTGDGTNDAPALKQADVGLAMGIAGNEVAKEASKIVLLDDSFTTIVKAVHWGRALYENIQRFIQFQLTINVSALAIAFLGPFLGVRPPFTVLQLLWINVIMDTFASIALCSEPPRPGLMRHAPKRKDESILSRPMLITILSTAGFFVVVMLILLLGLRYGGWFDTSFPDEREGWEFRPLTLRQVTIFFTVYVLFQVWNQINCRSLSSQRSGLSGLLRNPTFLAIGGLTLLGQVLIVTFGYDVFKVRPLGVVDWVVIAIGTASVLLFAELARYVRRARFAASFSER